MFHVEHEARRSGELRHAILGRCGEAEDPSDLSLEIADQCQLPDGRQSGRAVAFGGRETAVLVVRLRSEEHTSELQSLAYLVCRLLLEKKKKKQLPAQHCVRHTHIHARPVTRS